MTAALLAHRFTVITMPRRTMAMTDAVVRELGLGHRCVVRAVDEPVADVAHGSRHVLELFAAEAERALVEDSAEAILLGCAGLTELVAPLEERLGVPVIDGVASAVVLAEGLLAQGLATSRRSTWARPAAPTGAER
jgi:allantoin racemase